MKVILLERITGLGAPGDLVTVKSGYGRNFLLPGKKAIPANIGYNGYEKTSCISVNQVICHGIPNQNKILKDNDIVNIDVTVLKDGWYGKF